MIKKTLGGDRLGAGKRMTVDMRTYERSTHDLSYLWRSTMAAGTLVPFMSQVALPGDTWDITLDVDIKTHPTLGPLFGGYKVQLDVFQTPVRLYNSWLHNNKLGIGMNMSNIQLPSIAVKAIAQQFISDNAQINPAALLKYLGISGVGAPGTGVSVGDTMTREFNAIPLLAYWDIFKNYYANKQETNAYVIHNGSTEELYPTIMDVVQGVTTIPLYDSGSANITLAAGNTITLHYADVPGEKQIDALSNILIHCDSGDIPIRTLFPGQITVDADTLVLVDDYSGNDGEVMQKYIIPAFDTYLRLEPFPLANLDSMRELILSTAGNTILEINNTSLTPYSLPLKSYTVDGLTLYPVQASQEGLAVKTYNSDLFNNWIQTETQEYISSIAAVSTVGDSFTIDTLNMTQKVYNILNRIAASGGTYDDWIETVWTNDVIRKAETPMYMGGLIKELMFQEIISNATTQTTDGGNQPLGQLAGRGVLTNKHKGDKIQIRVNEPSYIHGIIHLTPRIDYSQGNTWDVNLESMDDFHKPELDEIGFQDLLTEQMAWFGSQVNSDASITQHSAGKQPAWLNYMTNVNRTYGNFADINNEMFMTLNRRYEADQINMNILDVTTYIDPTKFNFIFAETDLNAQNFWAQIAVNAEVRRKMSAKLIPNL